MGGSPTVAPDAGPDAQLAPGSCSMCGAPGEFPVEQLAPLPWPISFEEFHSTRRPRALCAKCQTRFDPQTGEMNTEGLRWLLGPPQREEPLIPTDAVPTVATYETLCAFCKKDMKAAGIRPALVWLNTKTAEATATKRKRAGNSQGFCTIECLLGGVQSLKARIDGK